jgi:hypothetical protein
MLPLRERTRLVGVLVLPLTQSASPAFIALKVVGGSALMAAVGPVFYLEAACTRADRSDGGE